MANRYNFVSSGAAAVDAIEQILIQREAEKRQALLDALAQKERDRTFGLRERELELQRQQEQRIAEAQKLTQQNLETEREYRRFANIAENIRPGEIGQETAEGLKRHGLDAGIVKNTPAVVLRLVGERKAPAAEDGDLPLLDRPAIDSEVLPERFESLGGTKFQSAEAQRKFQDEQAEANRTAAGERQAASLEAQREQREADRELKKTLAQIAASNRQTITLGQQATIAKGLRNDFTRDSKDFITTATAYRNLETTLGRGDAGGDLAGIFQFMKALDPGSVVREGEFANAQNSAGVPDRVRNYYNQLLKGTRLTPQQRQEFLSVSRGVYEAGLAKHNQRIAEYTADAEAFGIDPARVIRDVTVGSSQPSSGQTLTRTIRNPKTGETRQQTSSDGGQTWK